MENHCQAHGGNSEKIRNLEDNVKALFSHEKAFVQAQGEIRERLSAVEASSKSAHHRLDNQEEHTKAIYELASEVKTFGAKQENLLGKMSEILALLTDHDERLGDLEKKPGEEALDQKKQVNMHVLLTILGLMIGFMFSKLIGG